MIKLTKITKNNDTISCMAFVEDCKEYIKLVYNIKSGEFDEYAFPKNYEYCTSHIAYARNYFDKIISSKKALPNEKLIMWY